VRSKIKSGKKSPTLPAVRSAAPEAVPIAPVDELGATVPEIPPPIERPGTLENRIARLLAAEAGVPGNTDQEARELLKGIGTRDPVLGMLAAQMVLTHHMAMSILGWADARNVERDKEILAQGARFLRLYILQVEALGNYRNKGRQTVTVEHVQVNAAGEVAVAIVEHKPGGEGERGE